MRIKRDVDLFQSKIETTERTKRVTLKGQTRDLQVYRIPLSDLYYNDQNGRIATRITKLKADTHGVFEELTTEQLNEYIETMIKESNKQAYNKTYSNMRMHGQREPGVVLIDGRIVDGNRRFTCLRNLSRVESGQKFDYFEAIILDNSVSEKEIKVIELELQHGQDEKVDYDPIEKLVEIYTVVIKDKTLTFEEYADSIDEKHAFIKKKMKLAEIMADFLEYINAPEQFYIARELMIDGPLNEIYNIKQKIQDDSEKWDKVRTVLYDSMVAKISGDYTGDTTRTIRNLGKFVVQSSSFDEFFEKHIEVSKKINEALFSDDEVTTDLIRDKVRDDYQLTNDFKSNIDDAVFQEKRNTVRQEPITLLEDIKDSLDKIDLSIVKRFGIENNEVFTALLCDIEDKIEKVKSELNNGIE